MLAHVGLLARPITDEVVDYVVVGSGIGGSIAASAIYEGLAARGVQNCGSVLLLEAGGSGGNADGEKGPLESKVAAKQGDSAFSVPLDWGNTCDNGSGDWKETCKNQWLFEDSSQTVQWGNTQLWAGRHWGGNGKENAMLYVRPPPADFDGRWAALGPEFANNCSLAAETAGACANWTGAALLDDFHANERWAGESVGGASYGKNGPIPVSPPLYEAQCASADGGGCTPFNDALNSSWRAAGLPLSDELNGATRQGLAKLRYSIDPATAQRADPFEQAVKPILEGPSAWQTPDCFFRLQSDALVTRVVLKPVGHGKGAGVWADGVEYVVGKVTRRVTARREVVLAAGALNTPRLLKLSGVGTPPMAETIPIWAP